MAPADELEAQIQAVWQEVLLQERISTQSDFFTVGGNSLQARHPRSASTGRGLVMRGRQSARVLGIKAGQYVRRCQTHGSMAVDMARHIVEDHAFHSFSMQYLAVVFTVWLGEGETQEDADWRTRCCTQPRCGKTKKGQLKAAGDIARASACLSDAVGALLQAAKVMIRIRKATGSEVTTEQLFKAPTIAGLAAAIRRANPDVEAASAIPCADSSAEERAAGVPCSANQAQMAVLFQMQPESAAYNMSSAMRLLGRLDVGALEASSPPCVPLLSSLCTSVTLHMTKASSDVWRRCMHFSLCTPRMPCMREDFCCVPDPLASQAALAYMARRHEVLRTRLLERDGRLLQAVLPADDPAGVPRLQRHAPLRHGDLAAVQVQALAEAEAGRPFRLLGEVPARFCLFEVGPDDAVFLVRGPVMKSTSACGLCARLHIFVQLPSDHDHQRCS